MLDEKLEKRLYEAKSVEEVKDILKGHPELDAERIYQEIEKRHSLKAEKLDLGELDAISGGYRDWVKEGCAATCEVGSWCWSNDHCAICEVVYDNFWATCPDGHEHEFVAGFCKRCGCRDTHG